MNTQTTPEAKHTESLPTQLRIDADDCPRPDRAGLMIKAADRLDEYERKVRAYDALKASYEELIQAMQELLKHSPRKWDLKDLQEKHGELLQADKEELESLEFAESSLLRAKEVQA